jgi:hypothetical protein
VSYINRRSSNWLVARDKRHLDKWNDFNSLAESMLALRKCPDIVSFRGFGDSRLYVP